jgi:hypothetical protein
LGLVVAGSPGWYRSDIAAKQILTLDRRLLCFQQPTQV